MRQTAFEITLPWPPTANTYWRHVGLKTLISKNGRSYRKTVHGYVMENRFPAFGKNRLKVEIIAYPPDRRRRDLDNLLKATLDSLQHAGVYSDDSQIDDIRIKRGLYVDFSGELLVTIQEMES